jgi:hypothetical protein
MSITLSSGARHAVPTTKIHLLAHAPELSSKYCAPHPPSGTSI